MHKILNSSYIGMNVCGSVYENGMERVLRQRIEYYYYWMTSVLEKHCTIILDCNSVCVCVCVCDVSDEAPAAVEQWSGPEQHPLLSGFPWRPSIAPPLPTPPLHLLCVGRDIIM